MIPYQTRLNDFEYLGKMLMQAAEYIENNKQPEQEAPKILMDAAHKAQIRNQWFSKTNIVYNFQNWADALTISNLSNWLSENSIDKENLQSKTIGVVAAGNIPMVGMHDFISVLLAGQKLKMKLSAKDDILLPAIAEILFLANPEWKNYIQFETGLLKDFDAIIATGSDNTARYFETYFGKYPNIIRHNRTSVAILSDLVTDEQLQKLADDIFLYFGLGCRNVSKVFIPKNFDMNRLFKAFEKYKDIIQHNKYGNNFEYQLAIHLMNQADIFNTGNILLKESKDLFSPISVLLYEFYDDYEALKAQLIFDQHKLQCVVGEQPDKLINTTFGNTQNPGLTDFADNVNTFDFMKEVAKN